MLTHNLILNDKYFKKYNYLFNYNYEKFKLINNFILFNLMLKINNKICNNVMNYNYNESTYNYIILKKDNNKYPSLNFTNIIINKLLNNKINKKLILCNSRTIITNNKKYFDIQDNFGQLIGGDKIE